MKTIFFVRHGLTEGNEKDAYQFSTTELSELGLEQARIVAARFKTIPLQKIISSDFTRAVQTASIIGESLNVPVEQSALFEEINRPTAIQGKPKNDPVAKQIMRDIEAHFADANWHHSDEENFFDLKQRALNALAFLSSRSEDQLLVVTHGLILRILLGVMVFGDAYTPELYPSINRFFLTKNTGITMVQEDGGVYTLLTWNDHVHLGEF